jgi:hypothetical protein
LQGKLREISIWIKKMSRKLATAHSWLMFRAKCAFLELEGSSLAAGKGISINSIEAQEKVCECFNADFFQAIK